MVNIKDSNLKKRKFTGCIPLIATATVEIMAEDENEAMEQLKQIIIYCN